MSRKKSRLIIDTNLWVSFLLANNFSRLNAILTSDHVELIFSEELLDELIQVASRPKFTKYFAPNDFRNLLQGIDTIGIFIDVTSNVELCRDPKDNFLLSLAKDGKATHLLTGDKDLLILGHFGKTAILTITEYLAANA